MYDLMIIGSGPSGLAAALSAKRQGLDFLLLERDQIASTVRQYPLGKQLFSTSNEVELEPGALPTQTKPTREEVLQHYQALVDKEAINIRTAEEVRALEPCAAGFLVHTANGHTYRSRAVLVAVGGFGRPRRLKVTGENAARVSYHFAAAEPYAGQHILVVGGGNSAAQAALYLAEVEAKPTWSLRRATLDPTDPATGKPQMKIKPWVKEPLQLAVAQGLITIIKSSTVVEIRPHSACLAIQGSTEIVEVKCDHIFALIGADPDTTLLETAGAEIAADGRPVYHPETYETTVPGLYVAGHITRELHMKNALEVTPRIIEAIAARWSPTTVPSR
ncbi:MAG: NAD(P)-binding domain-containing protein [Acidobacteria bacterium]|nr:NAD(P)-binding domain-containing protein [Acidobacteriota bacterium]